MTEIKRAVCPANKRLMDSLLEQKNKPITPCGGRGNCGKCLVKVVEGELAVTSADRLWLSVGQIEEGYRLGCQAFPKEDVIVEFV